MKPKDFVIEIKFEEDYQKAKNKSRNSSTIIGVSIVEEAPTKDNKRNKSNEQMSKQSKKKFKGNYYNCDKAGQRYSDYRAPRKDKDKSEETLWERWNIHITCVQ